MAVAGIGAADVGALGVARHQAQAGDAECAEVVVVAQLPGALASEEEAAVGDPVDQVGLRRGAEQHGEHVLAEHALVAGRQGVPGVADTQARAIGAVVDAPGHGLAGFLVVEVAEGAQQCGAGAERLAEVAAQVVLVVDVPEVGEPVAGGQAGAPLRVDSGEVQLVAVLAGRMSRQVEGLAVAGGAGAGVPQLAGGQLETRQLLRFQQHALEGLRQHAHVVLEDHRQARLQQADLQRALRMAQLQGRAAAAVVVGRVTGAGVEGQAAVVAGAGAAVQFQGVHAGQVDTDSDGAFAVARTQAGDDRLGPTARPGLGRVVLAVVAEHVEVAQAAVEAGVVDQAGVGGEGRQGQPGEQQPDSLGVKHGKGSPLPPSAGQGGACRENRPLAVVVGMRAISSARRPGLAAAGRHRGGWPCVRRAGSGGSAGGRVRAARRRAGRRPRRPRPPRRPRLSGPGSSGR
ncbi:hypothetical protein D9M68_602170 [compost metagenome]